MRSKTLLAGIAGIALVAALTDGHTQEPLPLIGGYFVSGQLGDGVLVLDGYVPDAGTRDRLDALPGAVDATSLSLGRGAPDGLEATVQYAVDLMSRLNDGQFMLRFGRLTVSGTAASDADLAALENRVAKGAPGGVVVAATDIAPPTAANFAWSAVKDTGASGLELNGDVPSAAVRQRLLGAAGQGVHDFTALAAGGPDDFEPAALAGLAALQTQIYGRLAYAAGKWTLSGVAPTEAIDAANRAALAAAGATDATGWTYEVAVAPSSVTELPAPATPAPVVSAPAPPPAEPTPDIAVSGPLPIPQPLIIAPAPTFPGAIAPASSAVAPPAPSSPPPVVAAATPTPASPPATPTTEPASATPFAITVTKAGDGGMTVAGAVPAPTMRDYVGTLVGGDAAGLAIAGGAPDGFVTSLTGGVIALRQLDSGSVAFADGQWTLSGATTTVAALDAALASVPALPGGGTWTTAIDGPDPLTICRETVTAFSQRNAILFDSGNAHLADASTTALDELAGYLGRCPEANVEIEGHTDADGSADLNLALSVARAEAVVDGLIARGVDAGRLYAIGYGETLPIADNATTAGKRQNRRIVFSVVGG